MSESEPVEKELVLLFLIILGAAIAFAGAISLALHRETARGSLKPLVEQPAPPLAPGPLCVVVSELDMMEGRTMSRFQPYFDMGLTSCLVIYRPNTEDYSVCFCEVKR